MKKEPAITIKNRDTGYEIAGSEKQQWNDNTLTGRRLPSAEHFHQHEASGKQETHGIWILGPQTMCQIVVNGIRKK